MSHRRQHRSSMALVSLAGGRAGLLWAILWAALLLEGLALTGCHRGRPGKPNQGSGTRTVFPELVFDSELVEMRLETQREQAPSLSVRAIYGFKNNGEAAWVDDIIYPIWNSPEQPPPRHVVLSTGRERSVSCRGGMCAARIPMTIGSRRVRTLTLSYTQRLPSPRGPAVYMLTSGARWSTPIGRAQLRVLVPRGGSPRASYPLTPMGIERGADHREYEVYSYDKEGFRPEVDLRVTLEGSDARDPAGD